jgi:toxin ParE1/3/4
MKDRRVAEIVWTLEASRCLDEIYQYIASQSPTSAHKVVCGIYEKIQILRQHVRIGQRYEPVADREVREILYGRTGHPLPVAMNSICGDALAYNRRDQDQWLPIRSCRSCSSS